jgi:hypothetical protein
LNGVAFDGDPPGHGRAAGCEREIS